MKYEEFIEVLKNKYQYDDKLINALNKLFPVLLEYFGKEYESLIMKALEDTEIIPCNSYQTISILREKYELTKTYNENLVSSNFRNSDVFYLSNVHINYVEEENAYKIDKTYRKIILAHTFNLDSPKGLEVLTYGVVCLLKSYCGEYVIEDNYLYKKEGFQLEKKKIIYDRGNIYLDLEEEMGVGFNLGLNIYDTEAITSLILKDDYKCYDYRSIYKIAWLLKEKLKLKESIDTAQINNEKDLFISKYNEDLYNELLGLCDLCMNLEQEMIIYASKREEKDEISKRIKNILDNDVYMNLVKYIDFSREKRVKNLD